MDRPAAPTTSVLLEPGPPHADAGATSGIEWPGITDIAQGTGWLHGCGLLPTWITGCC